MSKFLQSVILLALAANLNSCTKSSNNLGVTTSDAPPAPSALGSQDYVQVANLSAVHTGDSLQQLKSNQVKISGTGTQSTYTVQYQFNSGSYVALRYLGLSTSTVTTSSTGGCSVDQAVVTLNHTTILSPQEAVISIEPNSDYLIEVAVKQNCDTLTLTIEPTIWVGMARASDPQMARRCDGQHGEQITFFAINGITGYSNMQAGKAYLDMYDFCGEAILKSEATQCRFDDSSLRPLEDHITCTATVAKDQHSFDLTFGTKDGTGSFACKTNGVQTYSETLANCDDMVLDHGSYAKPF